MNFFRKIFLKTEKYSIEIVEIDKIMKERLCEFLEYLGMGQTKFEEKVGLSRGFVNTLKNNLTIKTLDKIEAAYPELNINWLKTGEGEMLKNSQTIGDISNSTVVGANVNGTGITISHNDFAGMIDLQKGYQDVIKKNQEQIDKLIQIIERTIDNSYEQ
jgi:transcriptional regulator with XRE-family HTH domain